MEIETRNNIAKWENLTNEITEKWIIDYFEIEEGEEIDFDWVADEVGTIFQFADYFFNFNDVLTCYKLGITREQLLSWHDLGIESQKINISLAKYILSPEERKTQEEEYLKELKGRVKWAEKILKEALDYENNRT